MELLTSLENIAEMTDGQVAEKVYHLSSDFFFFFSPPIFHQDSTKMTKAIKNKQTKKKQHKSLSTAITTYTHKEQTQGIVGKMAQDVRMV